MFRNNKAIFTSLSFCFFSSDIYASSTCVRPHDWLNGFCDLPEGSSDGNSRCVVNADNWVARGACTPETQGCAEIGGCIGNTPIGHWYPYKDVDGRTYRCRCGCFGEETVFTTILGTTTGTELIAASKAQSQELLTLDSFDSNSFSQREINGVVFGPEAEDVYVISTDRDKTITLSKSHPVFIVDSVSKFSLMKTADQVNKMDLLLNDEGVMEKITRIEKKKYKGRVVNFNVASPDVQNHIVSANGLLMGDNTWQQRLASVDARLLLRADVIKELNKEKQTGTPQ